MRSSFDQREFHNFRWAHAHANYFLYTLLFLLALLVGLARQIFGAEFDFLSVQSLFVFGFAFVLCLPVPYLGYRLARYIVGRWYQDDFGSSYRAYRANEKRVEEQRKDAAI